MDPSKMKIVYSIQENKGKSYFTRIGVAFVNRDGSLNVRLNCLPVNGEMHIRDQEPKREYGKGEVESEGDYDPF